MTICGKEIRVDAKLKAAGWSCSRRDKDLDGTMFASYRYDRTYYHHIAVIKTIINSPQDTLYRIPTINI